MDYNLKLRKEGYRLIRTEIREGRLEDIDKTLKEIQTTQAKQVLDGTSPSIILLTDNICKSACSVFGKVMMLFPSIIVVGRPVQGFNLSGN